MTPFKHADDVRAVLDRAVEVSGVEKPALVLGTKFYAFFRLHEQRRIRKDLPGIQALYKDLQKESNGLLRVGPAPEDDGSVDMEAYAIALGGDITRRVEAVLRPTPLVPEPSLN